MYSIRCACKMYENLGLQRLSDPDDDVALFGNAFARQVRIAVTDMPWKQSFRRGQAINVFCTVNDLMSHQQIAQAVGRAWNYLNRFEATLEDR